MNDQATKTCPVCGESFRSIIPHKRFCSQVCSTNYHNRSKHPPKAEPAVCKQCGADFIRPKSNYVYCSPACRAESQRHRSGNGVETTRKRRELANRIDLGLAISGSLLGKGQTRTLEELSAFCDCTKENIRIIADTALAKLRYRLARFGVRPGQRF